MRQSKVQIAWFYWVPKKGISRCVGYLARSRCRHLGRFLIFLYRRLFKVDLADALLDSPSDYVSLNDFFTRALKPDARPIASGESVVASPCDGTVGQLGRLSGSTLLQAKGQCYTAGDFLAGIGEGEVPFIHGHYVTIYLSPKDYHRVHMPLSGRLTHMKHVPGQLFPVFPKAVASVSQLYVRNERVLFWFETEQGPMVLAMIGAMNVGSVTVTGYGDIASTKKTATEWSLSDVTTFDRGEELAYFNMGGSCVVVLFPEQVSPWLSQWQPGQSIRMGQALNEALSFSE